MNSGDLSENEGLIGRIYIEKPCESAWEKMTGNDTVRFCQQCNLNVYNISDMSDKEAEAILAKGKKDGRLCTRLYLRPDGTVMTDNCPRALRKIRDSSKWLRAKIVAGFALVLFLLTPAQAETLKKMQKNMTLRSIDSALMGDTVSAPAKKTTKTFWATVKPSTNTKTATEKAADAGSLIVGQSEFSFLSPAHYQAKIEAKLQSEWKKTGIPAPFPTTQFKIDEHGVPYHAKTLVSSGNSKVDAAAISVIHRCIGLFGLPQNKHYEITVSGVSECSDVDF
jgi:hypothetical protein